MEVFNATPCLLGVLMILALSVVLKPPDDGDGAGRGGPEITIKM